MRVLTALFLLACLICVLDAWGRRSSYRSYRRPAVRRFRTVRYRRVPTRRITYRRIPVRRAPVRRITYRRPVRRITYRRPVRRITYRRPTIRRTIYRRPATRRITFRRPTIRRTIFRRPTIRRTIFRRPTTRRITFRRPTIRRTRKTFTSTRRTYGVVPAIGGTNKQGPYPIRSSPLSKKKHQVVKKGPLFSIRPRDESGHRTGMGTLIKSFVKKPSSTFKSLGAFFKNYQEMRKKNLIGGNLKAHEKGNYDATKIGGSKLAGAISALREQYKRYRIKTNPDGTRHMGDTRSAKEIKAVMDANRRGREKALEESKIGYGKGLPKVVKDIAKGVKVKFDIRRKAIAEALAAARKRLDKIKVPGKKP